VTIAAGQIGRWRIVNASSARYVRLSLGGLPFQIIGTDGGMIGVQSRRARCSFRRLTASSSRLAFRERRRGVERFATIRVGVRHASSRRARHVARVALLVQHGHLTVVEWAAAAVCAGVGPVQLRHHVVHIKRSTRPARDAIAATTAWLGSVS
jgi:hypothetical protein